MKSKFIFFLLSSLLFITASCRKGSETSRRIPNDVSLVVHINAASLNSKLSWKEIKESDWFKKEYKVQSDSLTKKLMDNPENAGIDLSKDLIMFIKQQGAGNYMAFQGILNDESDFEKFNKSLDKNAVKIENLGISTMKVNEMLATWKDKHFVYLFGMPGSSLYSNMGEAGKIPDDSLFKYAAAIFDLHEDNSLAKDERFTDMMQEKGDAHVWINSEKLYGGMQDQMGMMNMIKMDALMQGNVSASTLNFENGKVTVKSRQFANPLLTAIYRKLGDKEQDEELFNHIPSENVVGILALSYPPQVIKDLIVLIGADGMLNGLLGKMDYSIDEFISAQGGDVLLLVSDIELSPVAVPASFLPQDTDPQAEIILPETPAAKQQVKVLFITSIGDKAAFDKLSELVSTQVGPLMHEMPPLTGKQEGKWFAIGNDAGQVNGFLSGKVTNQPFASKIKGHPIAMYIDIQKIANSMEPVATSVREKERIADIKKTWVDAFVTGGEFKDGHVESYGEINFTDKNTNSLRLLNMFIDRMSVEEETGLNN